MSDETPSPAHRRRWPLSAILGVVWLGAVGTGLAALAIYDNSPGVAAHAAARWPASSRLPLDRAEPTLVMLVHPRCTCTRASLSELAELMARAPRRPRAHVVFVHPGTTAVGRQWETTDLWARAAAIPGVAVTRDDDGHEAALFGGETSGQAYLYAPDGTLLYSGGTTGARGHAGDNAGRAAILALLRREAPARREAPVFGCALFAEGDRADGDRHGGHGETEATHGHPR